MSAHDNLPTPELVNEWAAEAGAIALDYFSGSRRAKISSKPDRSIVTEADKAVEKFLAAKIREAFPGHGVIGEEGARVPSGPGEPVWIIDPIDGTSMFADQWPGWCVSIGVFRGGLPWLGCVFLPACGKMFWVDAQGRALWNGEPISASERDARREPTLLLTTHAHHQIDNRWPGRCLTLGAVAADICYVARGAAVALTARPHVWDVAAALAIAKGAGAEILSLNTGGPFDIGGYLREPGRRPDDHLLVCSPEFKAQALETLNQSAEFRARLKKASSLQGAAK